jgi:ribokinase
MASIVVIGSANTDMTVKVERLPGVNETVSGGETMISFGGKGANQALAALQAGGEVFFLCRIGMDPNGERLCRHLVRAGLPYAGLLRDDEQASGLALIAVDQQGNNQIVVAPGSNRALQPSDVEAIESELRQASIVLLQLETPLETVERALRLGRSLGLTTILDPAPVRDLPDHVYPLIDILTPNQSEAARLSGLSASTETEARAAAEKLRGKGCGSVLVTMGAAGALLCCGHGTALIPPFEVQAVDSVAAGDAFNGALASALARGMPLEEAASFASAAGALCASKRGAQEALPDRTEVERLQVGGGRSGSRQ